MFNNVDTNFSQKEILEYFYLSNKTFIISKTDAKGIITFVNEKFCTISGYTQKELIGANHNIVRNKRVPSSLFKRLWETIQSGQIFQGVIRNKAKDGSSYVTDVNIFPLTNEDGKREYLSIRTDITQYALAKEQEVLDASDKMKIIINTDGKIINYNKKTLKVFENITPNMHMKDILPSSFIENVIVDILFQHIKDEVIEYKSHTYQLEIEKLTEDYVITFIDITTVVNMQKEYNQKILENKDKMLLMFTHELKTPLNGILGFSQVLSKRLRRGLTKEITQTNLHKYINMSDEINTLGEKLHYTIASLLDSMKINKGEYQLHKTNFQLSNLLKNKISLLQKIYNQNIKYDMDDFTLFSDKYSIEHLFSNLISNAYKYGNGEVYTNLKQIGNRFKLTIEDNGDGIKAKDLSKIFEPFEQLDQKELTRKTEGTGTGLHFVKLLCTLLHFTIDIQKSERLGGASFIISGEIK